MRGCGASPRATASCSRACRSASRAPPAPRSPRSSPDTSASIPYTTAVSDVYQDLFHEGSFVGKGIYDVDAFEAALARPRAGEHAAQPRSVRGLLRARRPVHRHRAGRRLPVELPRVRGAAAPLGARRLADCRAGCGARCRTRERPPSCRNTLPVIARWKILDNLRRSLLAAGAGRAVRRRLDGAAGIGAALDGAGACWCSRFPPTCRSGGRSAAGSAACRCASTSWPSATTSPTSARQAFLSTVFLLHQSGVMLDAIGRTLLRLLVTRRRLLEWVTADRSAHVEASAGDVSARRCAGTPMTPALIAHRCVALIAPARLPLAAADSRAVVPLAGDRLRDRPAAASATWPRCRAPSARRSAASARKTWRFFEEFVGPGDHWLIPDNIQENRRDLVAHRTSPTNIGLQLLSTLAAYDFGYVTLRRPARPARADVRHAAAHAALSRPFLQLVRHAHARAAARRPTSRPSTAATSPAISSRCAPA